MISIQITPEFVNDEKLKSVTARLAMQAVPYSNLLTMWSHVAKKVLQSGQFYLRAPKMKELSAVVEIDEKVFVNPVFAIFEELDMIKRTEIEAPVSVLGEADFENFWATYPARNGKKIGKVVAKRRFFNVVRTREQFDQIMDATVNYGKACGGYPKDAERFLKNDFWKEYMSDKPAANVTTASEIEDMLNNA
jgi:hypothetical protein